MAAFICWMQISLTVVDFALGIHWMNTDPHTAIIWFGCSVIWGIMAGMNLVKWINGDKY